MTQPFLFLLFTLAYLASTTSALSAPPTVVTYPAPPGLKPAPDFKLWVNDKEVFLHQTQPAAVGIFSFSGPVIIRVSATQDMKWVDIRPKSRQLVPKLNDNQLTFTLTEPGQFSIEFHNEIKRVIHLFANPLEQNPPKPNDPNVRYIKAGVHNLGMIDLKDGEHLYLEGGAVVKGAVQATKAKNIRISGRGVLDGDSLAKGTRMILLNQVDGAAIEGITLLNSHTWTVEPMFSRNLTIDNLKIVNWDFGSDGIDLVGTSHVKIRNSFVRANDDCIVIKTWNGTDKYAQQNGVGPDVEDIDVSNCTFWNMPWGNALEIGFELRANTIRNIVFRDCDIIHVERGAAMSIHNGDFATVENIRFEDIRVEDARHKLIDLAIFLSQYSTDRPTDEAERKKRYKNGVWDGVLWVYPGEEAKYAAKRGAIRDVVFRNIQVIDGPVPFSVISGFDAQHTVSDVRIENLSILGRKVKSLADGKFVIERAEQVKVE